METAVNTYGGLNRDYAYDSIPSTYYIDALDVRITASEGASNAAITNIKGNTLSFSIPQLGVGLSEIIGATAIRNTIVLFITDNSNKNGWIYTIVYNEATQSISVPLTLVYYNPDLNFSKQNPIEAVGRFESAKTQRIYWSDYNEPLRSLNIVDPGVLTTSLDLLSTIPGIKYTQPLLKSISTVGSLLVGKYQFAYRLITFDGKQTLISPPSNMIHVTKSSESTYSSDQYIGLFKGENSGKSLLIEIDISNYHSFEKIELISIFHEDYKGTPSIKSIDTKTITTGSTLQFTYTGNETTTYPITTIEFALKSYPFSTCKTLTQVDNSLLIANLKSKTFSIKDRAIELGETFDASTYRYKNVAGTITQSTDVFNTEYNKDAHWDKDWHYLSQYKYKSDGLRLGGQGPNISYTFHLETTSVSGLTAGYANIGITPDPTHNLNDGYTYSNNTYPSPSSPFLSGLLTGYKRGETYRFGIIFYTTKGETSFVEYIGDIKFPDISDQDSVVNNSGTNYFITSTASGGVLQAHNLGIKFSIDFSSCPTLLSEIDSYQIVRVDRQSADKRRICSGTFNIFTKSPINTNAGAGYDLRISGSDQVLHLTIETAGYYNYLKSQLASSGTPDVIGDYINYQSPELSYDFDDCRNRISTNDCYLLMTGGYKTKTFNITVIDTGSAEKLGHVIDNRSTWYDVVPVDKVTTTATYPTIGQYRGIEYVKKLNSKTYVSMGYNTTPTDIVTPSIGSYYVRNFYAKAKPSDATTHLNRPNGEGYLSKGPSGLLSKMTKVTSDPLSGNALTTYSSYDYFDTTLSNVELIGSTDGKIILDILLPKVDAYGGNSQNALENNTFIPASPVIKKTNTSPIVFGGDIYMNAYTHQLACTLNDSYYFEGASTADRIYYSNNSHTHVYVTESCINIDLDYGCTLKRGVTFTANGVNSERYRQETGNTSTNYGRSDSMYAYNSVYSEIPTDLSFFVKPLSIDFSNVNDIRSMLSNVKINDEKLDSWTVFATNNYWDVDDYGPINKILKWKAQTYFFQDKAVGVYAINVRTMLSTADGVPTQLGSGQGFERHQYLTTEDGSIHQWGVKATDTSIYYFSAITKKLMSVAEGNLPISEVKGFHSLLSSFDGPLLLRKENLGDNPILGKGITIAKDNLNDEILFTFKGCYANNSTKAITLVYDEVAQEFSSIYSATPGLYIENRNMLLSANPFSPKDVYAHNKGNYGTFYGNIQEAYVKVVVNENADLNKVIRFIEFNSIVKDSTSTIDRNSTITAFEISTENQSTGKILFSADRFKHKFNKWRLKIPRDQNSVSQHGRLRNTYFIVTLYFDNSANKQLILNRLLTHYDAQMF